MNIDETKAFDEGELGFPSLEETQPAPEVKEIPIEAEVKTETIPKEESVKETVVTPDKNEEVKDVKISNPPVQYDGESDIQFNLRTQLYNAGQAKAQAETDEEKSVLSKHMKDLRKEMGKNSLSPKESAQTTPETPEKTEEFSQTEEEAAKIALKKLGVPDKDEVLNLVKEMLQSQRVEADHSSAISEFYSKRPDIASDPEKMKMLENVVIQNFNVSPQTSRQQLLIAMDMAASYVFPKTNKSAAVNTAADKRDLLNISSNTQTVKTVDKNDERTSAALKDTGMSMKDMGWD